MSDPTPDPAAAARWDRIESLFEAAAGRPTAERDAYLSAACADDPTVLAEVRALLVADPAAAGFFVELGRDLVPLWSERDGSGSTARGVGERIGPYRLVRLVGQGGMGSVYEAERADGQFEQRVAVKLLRDGMPGLGGGLGRRFLIERQILARLEHPNIARLLDGGMMQGDVPYLVMEYVEGTPIDRFCDEHRLPVEARLELVRTVCAAVQHAHQNLVVHRDLKPSNILVTADGTVKLLDFGIAKLLIDSDATASERAADLTRTGSRPMTLAYASPEQIQGRPITTASDVYALGVVLYELLTGRRPFGSATGSAFELERAICETEATAPSRAVEQRAEPDRALLLDDEAAPDPAAVAEARSTTVRRLRDGLRGDLDCISAFALRKEPAQRYASAEALATDLRRHLTQEPVAAHRGTFRYRAGKLAARYRAATLAVGLVTLSLIGGIAGTAWQARVAGRERDRAQASARLAVQQTQIAREERNRAEQSAIRADRQAALASLARDRAEAARTDADEQTRLARTARDRATLEAAKSTQVAGFLTGLFQIADPGETQGDQITARELLDRGTARIETDLADQPQVRSAMMTLMGRVYRDLGLYDRAEPMLERSLAFRQGAGIEPLDVAEGEFQLARVRHARGEYDQAETLYRHALATRRRWSKPLDPALSETLHWLGVLTYDKGDFVGAERLHRESLALRERSSGLDSPAAASSLSELARCRRQLGDGAGAERLFRQTLDTRRRRLGPIHPEIAESLNNLAAILKDQGSYMGAKAMYGEAIAMYGKLYGGEHPTIALGLNNLGSLANRMGQPVEAEGLFRQSLAMWRDLLGPTEASPRIATELNNLGHALLNQGRIAEAEPLLVEALAMRRATLGESHPDLAITALLLAELTYTTGRLDEAEQRYRDALEIHRRAYPAGHPKLARPLIGLAHLLLVGRGQPQAAEPFAREAVAVLNATSGADRIGLASAGGLLGGCLSGMGRYDEAEPLLMAAYRSLSATDPAVADRRLEAAGQLATLYRSWGRPAEAARYMVEDEPRSKPLPPFESTGE